MHFIRVPASAILLSFVASAMANEPPKAAVPNKPATVSSSQVVTAVAMEDKVIHVVPCSDEKSGCEDKKCCQGNSCCERKPCCEGSCTTHAACSEKTSCEGVCEEQGCCEKGCCEKGCCEQVAKGESKKSCPGEQIAKATAWAFAPTLAGWTGETLGGKNHFTFSLSFNRVPEKGHANTVTSRVMEPGLVPACSTGCKCGDGNTKCENSETVVASATGKDGIVCTGDACYIKSAPVASAIPENCAVDCGSDLNAGGHNGEIVESTAVPPALIPFLKNEVLGSDAAILNEDSRVAVPLNEYVETIVENAKLEEKSKLLQETMEERLEMMQKVVEMQRDAFEKILELSTKNARLEGELAATQRQFEALQARTTSDMFKVMHLTATDHQGPQPFFVRSYAGVPQWMECPHCGADYEASPQIAVPMARPMPVPFAHSMTVGDGCGNEGCQAETLRAPAAMQAHDNPYGSTPTAPNPSTMIPPPASYPPNSASAGVATPSPTAQYNQVPRFPPALYYPSAPQVLQKAERVFSERKSTVAESKESNSQVPQSAARPVELPNKR